jgi:integrase
MAVRKDQRDGRWRYRVVVHRSGAEPIRISGTPQLNTKRAAEEAEREHIGRVLARGSAAIEEKKEVPKFEVFVNERWLPTYPAAAGNRPTSVREKAIHVRLHLLPVFGRLALDQIRGEVVDRFFAGLRKPRAVGKEGKRLFTLSDKSIKNIRATLRRILASAVEWGLIDKIPLLPKVKVADKGWDFFSREEVGKLVATARDDDERALLLFALDTGARAGEQLALEWGDLDWHSKLVLIRRSSTRGGADQIGAGAEGADDGAARGGATPREASARQARVLPGGRQAAYALAASRAAVGSVPASGAAGDPVARLSAHLRLSARDGGRAAPAGAGLARALHDRDDDAVRAPRARERRLAHPRARSARRWRRRGNHVATALAPGKKLRN